MQHKTSTVLNIQNSAYAVFITKQTEFWTQFFV